jgi:hypothetical protein
MSNAVVVAQEIGKLQKKLKKVVQKKSEKLLNSSNSSSEREGLDRDVLLQQMINIKMKRLAKEIPFTDSQTRASILNLIQ